MQINRLLEIVTLLLKNKTMTAPQLAQHFQVSVRTILRDITVLSSAGIPVVTAQGRGGGISLLEEYIVNKAIFSNEEQHEILSALQSACAAGPQTSNALTKLSAIFQKNAEDWLEIDISRWGQGQQDNRKFSDLKQAILQKQITHLVYITATGEETPRTVAPLKLVFKSQAWYLQCFCFTKQQYRTFKLNRILTAKASGKFFNSGQYSPPPIENNPTPPLQTTNILLTFPKHCAQRLYDIFDTGCIEKNDDGSLQVFARLPENEWLYSLLLSFGKDVTIISPAHIKEKMTAKAFKT